MKTVITLLICIVQYYTYSQTVDLTVKLSPIESQKGVIELSIYNTPSKFPKVGETYKMVRLKPTGKELTYTFKGLKPGKYAVCTYHDENANKTCDKNMFGIPTEAYAFSNDVRPVLSAPTFEQCAISLTKSTTTKIKMVY